MCPDLEVSSLAAEAGLMGANDRISFAFVRWLESSFEEWEVEYHVPPAISLRSNTQIFSKYFSAENAAAVIAPVRHDYQYTRLVTK